MARALVETLERYGIAHKVSTYGIREERSSPRIQTGSITADNATNNDKLMDELENLLRAYGFRGRARRVRCFAHTLNLAAKATIRQFERKKGNRKKRKDNDEVPDFEDLPLLESIAEEDSDDELDDDLIDEIEMPGLVDIEEDAEDGSNEAVQDEEEIVNVFATLTNEEKERWKTEVMPIRSALSKVSHASIVTWRLLT
jgi:hypothetical protein